MESLFVPSLLNEPARRFWAKEDLSADYGGKDDGRAEHQSPCKIFLKATKGYPHDVTYLDRCQLKSIGFKHIAFRRRSIGPGYNFKRTYHNPKSGPDLPLHHQRPTNRSRRAFCSVHRDRCRFSSDAQAQDKTSGKEIRPRLDNTFPNGSHGCYEARNEDGATTTEITVKWFSQPAAENGTGKIRSSDYQAGKVVGFGSAQLVFI